LLPLADAKQRLEALSQNSIPPPGHEGT
jgi:hypothetical protein